MVGTDDDRARKIRAEIPFEPGKIQREELLPFARDHDRALISAMCRSVG